MDYTSIAFCSISWALFYSKGLGTACTAFVTVWPTWSFMGHSGEYSKALPGQLPTFLSVLGDGARGVHGQVSSFLGPLPHGLEDIFNKNYNILL